MRNFMKITLSVIKADTDSIGGHNKPSAAMVKVAHEQVDKAIASGLLVDGRVTFTGDDIALLMTHTRGVDNSDIHKLAWDTFLETTKVAKSQGLYGAGQDLLSDAFSGNIRGMGPGSAEMEIEERPSEPILVFMGDKTSAGAFNLPLYKMFVDPFNTPGLIIGEGLHEGFAFEIQDVPSHPPGLSRGGGLHEGSASETQDPENPAKTLPNAPKGFSEC